MRIESQTKDNENGNIGRQSRIHHQRRERHRGRNGARFAQEGAQVALADVQQENGEKLRDEIIASGGFFVSLCRCATAIRRFSDA